MISAYWIFVAFGSGLGFGLWIAWMFYFTSERCWRWKEQDDE